MLLQVKAAVMDWVSSIASAGPQQEVAPFIKNKVAQIVVFFIQVRVNEAAPRGPCAPAMLSS
jgi:hypothetical protein